MNGTVQIDAVKAALESLKARNEQTEVLLAEFPVMQGFAIIPHEAVISYLSEEGQKTSSEVVAKFSGEIFDRSCLVKLEQIRDAVTEKLSSYGVLLGRCCTYQVATADHQAIVAFLNNKKAEYESLVANMLQNYDSIVADHKAKLQAVVTDPAACDALISKIPTKEKIEERHHVDFRFFKGYCPEEDDLDKASGEIMAAFELAKKQDLAFVEKVSRLFSQFLEAPSKADRLGKRYNAFQTAVETALSYEKSTKLVLAGSEYEGLVKAQFDILHQAQQHILAVNPDRRVKERIAGALHSKFKQVAYVLSDSSKLQDFADGKISLFEGNFIGDEIAKAKGMPVSAPLPLTEAVDVVSDASVQSAEDTTVSTAVDEAVKAAEEAKAFAEAAKAAVESLMTNNNATEATEATEATAAEPAKATEENTASDVADVGEIAGQTVDSLDLSEFFGEPAEPAKAEAETVKVEAEEPKEITLDNLDEALAELFKAS